MRGPWEQGTDGGICDARVPREREPLKAIEATGLWPKTELGQGVTLNGRPWVEDMTRTADGRFRGIGGQE